MAVHRPRWWRKLTGLFSGQNPDAEPTPAQHIPPPQAPPSAGQSGNNRGLAGRPMPVSTPQPTGLPETERLAEQPEPDIAATRVAPG
ncbi:MAG: hypothetical protein ACRDTD_32860, partial [Pseudonocardiaceae bacterium]